MSRRASEAAPLPICVLALVRRERVRTIVRTAFPRRRAHVQLARSAIEIGEMMVKQLVDAVLVDASAGEDAAKALQLAAEFPSIPFMLMTGLLPHDAPLIGRAAELGLADLLERFERHRNTDFAG